MIGSITGVCIYEAVQLLCDIVKSKLVLRGYRKLLFTSFAPALQIVSLIIYGGTTTTKARLIAKTISEVGLSIWKGEQEIRNIIFFIIDLALFGEIVMITTNSQLSIFRNETESSIDALITTLSEN